MVNDVRSVSLIAPVETPSYHCPSVRSAIRKFQGQGHLFANAGVTRLRVPGSVEYRVYYPGVYMSDARPVYWFKEGPASFAHAFLQMGLSRLESFQPQSVGSRAVKAAIQALSWFTPVQYLAVPNAFRDLKPVDLGDETTGLGLIVFSHGLTGTSEEHTLMLADIARRGYVVVALTHQDGSAARARLDGGAEMFYQNPNWDKETTDFRPRQILKRRREVEQMRSHFFKSGPEDIVSLVDPQRVTMMGFSYGAATAALESVTNPNAYNKAVFWDGWFSIDFSTFRNPPKGRQKFRFPRQAHDRGLSHASLFIGSVAFRRRDGLFEATCGLADSARRDGRDSKARGRTRSGRTSPPPPQIGALDRAPGAWTLTLPGSTHSDFVDVPFWLPRALVGLGEAVIETTANATASKSRRDVMVDNLRRARDTTLEFLAS